MLFTFFFTILVCVLVVFVHYESLLRLSILMHKLRVLHRLRILIAVIGVLTAHVFEVWIFALGHYLLVTTGKFGTLIGDFSGGLLDYSYYSFSTYTSLGFGDITPEGPIRFLTGMEALTGLVLIAWTASFMFLEMQRYWDDQRNL